VADEAGLHRRSPKSRKSYLNICPTFIAAAISRAADAIHPATASWLENDPSPQICIAHGLTFRGPVCPEAIAPWATRATAKPPLQRGRGADDHRSVRPAQGFQPLPPRTG